MNRRIILGGAAALLSAGLMLAAPQDNGQSAPPPEQGNGHAQHRAPDPNRQVKMLTKKLNLSADQQQQLLPVLQARQQQMESIRNDGSLSQTDRRDKMRAAHEDSENKIKAILTDSQKQTYEQMQQQMRARMQERRQGNQPQEQQQQQPQ